MRRLLTPSVALAATSALALVALPARAQFGPSANSPFYSGHNPTGIVTADFNGDQIPDLAVTNQSDNSVTVFFGDGKGNFAPLTGPNGIVTIPVGQAPSAIAAGKFTSSGFTDLAVANINDNNLMVLAGDGKGGLTLKQKLPTDGGPVAIALGDFNGDGKQDIATANLDAGTVTVYLGNGDYTFGPEQPIRVGQLPIAITSGDFNSDGFDDIAVANEGDGSVSVIYGSKAYSAPTAADPLTSPTLTKPKGVLTQSLSAITAGNFTNHPPGTVLDLAVTYYDQKTLAGNVMLFSYDPSNPSAPPSTPTVALFSPYSGNQPWAIGHGYFSPTHFDLLAIVNYQSGNVAVYMPDGSDVLTAFKGSPYATGALPRAIAVGDFNADGLADLAIANYYDGTVTVLLNQYPTIPVMVNAASDTSPVAPGSIVSIYGAGMAPLPNQTSPTAITLTDSSGAQTSAAVIMASPTQINAMIDPSAATGAASFSVNVPGASGQRGAVTVNSVAPALFSASSTGKGPAAGFAYNIFTGNSQYLFSCTPPKVPTAAATCSPNQITGVQYGATEVILYGTGIRNHAPSTPVTCTVNGVSAPVLYAGEEDLAPGVGVDEVRTMLPATLAGAGTVFVQIGIGSATSNQVTINIQ